VLARIKAILRRSATLAPAIRGGLGGKKLHFSGWILDVDRRSLSRDAGQSVPLTAADFQLLLAFLERPRTVLSRETLLDLTASRAAGPFDRAIDNQVSRLRRKIEENPARPELIATFRGGGYSLVSDVEEMI
jgi:two-component system, OmpR family, response regulator